MLILYVLVVLDYIGWLAGWLVDLNHVARYLRKSFSLAKYALAQAHTHLNRKWES